MSRLLTLLILYRSGYIVGKYISLEKLIADHKEGYYCETFPPGYINRSGTNMPFAKPMVPGRWSRTVRAMALREIYFLFLYSVGGFSAGTAAVLFILFLHRMAG